jgi:hypothetical protein
MSELDEVIDISFSIADPPLGLTDFSVPLIATTLSSPQATAFGGDVTRDVTPSNWKAAMTEVGVATSEDPYIAFATLFGQEDARPSRAVWGRRATAVAQVYTYTVPASPADGDYEVLLDGVAFTFPASGSTQTAVRDGLIALIDADPLYASVSASASTFTVTASTAGRPFTSSVDSPGDSLTQALTTPNVGLDTDIALFEAENPLWYFLLENSRSDAAAHAAAGALQGMIKCGLLQTDDADAQGTASLTDIASELNARGLTRVAMMWHSNDDEWLDAALAGGVGPLPWGSATYVHKLASLVTGIVATNTSRLTSKRYTWLARYIAAGVSRSRGGRMIDGTPIDLRIGADALRNKMQIAAFEALGGAPKISYTDDDADIIKSVVRSELLNASGEPHRFIERSTIDVRIPRVSEQTSTDRGNRHFPGVVWAARAQGAIESMGITGTISV